MKTAKAFRLLLLFVAVVFTSCEKDGDNQPSGNDDNPGVIEFTTDVENEAGIAPATGNGTEDNPYIITTPQNVKWLKEQSIISIQTKDKYYKLAADIHVTSATWVPILYFDGIFDGDNHKITGTLKAPSSSSLRYGFIGMISSASVVKNIAMEAEVIAPDVMNVGGLVGSARMGMGNEYFLITRCTNTNKVIGKGSVGGIVGEVRVLNSAIKRADQILISGCINKGEISGSGDCVGGIFGQIYIEPSRYITDNSDVIFSVQDCKNEGEITGTAVSRYVGGIVGQAAVYLGTLDVKDCVNGNSAAIKAGDESAAKEQGSSANRYVGLIMGGSTYVSGSCEIGNN